MPKPKTIDCTPNWPNVVKALHRQDSPAYWQRAVNADESGWFAAVAVSHPLGKIQRIGLRCAHFKPGKTYAGVSASWLLAVVAHAKKEA